MKKNQILWMSALVLTMAGLSSCSDDDGLEPDDYDKAYQIGFFNQPSYAKNKQGYWYTDEHNNEVFYKMIPNTQAPYTLLVIPKGEKGLETIEHLKEKKDYILNIQEVNEIEKHYFVTTNKYFESPNLYVSVPYLLEENGNKDHPLHVIPKFGIKIKDGYDISSVEQKYKSVLSQKEVIELKTSFRYYKFDCNKKNSYEVLKLSEEIYHMDAVEWIDVDMYGAFWAF